MISDYVESFKNKSIYCGAINDNSFQLSIILQPIISYTTTLSRDTINNNNICCEIKSSKNNKYNISINRECQKNIYSSKHLINLALSTMNINNSGFSYNFNNSEDMIILNDHELLLLLDIINKYTLDKKFDMHRYCIMCHNSMPSSNGSLECCKKCSKEHSYFMIYNNMITDAYKKDVNLLKLLLHTMICASGHRYRFTPVPEYCNNVYDEKLIQLPNMKLPGGKDYFVNQISKCDNDMDLNKVLTMEEYMLIKHTIKSNNTRLNYYSDSQFIPQIEDMWNNGYILFTLDHPPEKQALFDSQTDIVHLFHGSGEQNWYSIMRNGLKNLSGTQLMSCGAAYGPGIYLSGVMSYSMGYCRGGAYCIIGVVQVLNSDKYHKGSQIYVVPNVSDVLLKYIIVYKKEVIKKLDVIEKYLRVDLPRIKKTGMRGYKIHITRIQKEITEFESRIKKVISHYGNDLIIKILDNIKFEGDEFFRCIPFKFDIMYLNTTINCTVLFPSTYPLNPCQITCTCDNLSLVTIPFIEHIDGNTYSYNDPVLKYDAWKSNIRMFMVMIKMIENIMSYSKN